MIHMFPNSVGQDYGSLGELNVRRAHAKARLASSQIAGDREAQETAKAELIELDEAIGTVLATLALRNAEIARLRQAAA